MTAKREITAPTPKIPTNPAIYARVTSPLVFGRPDAAPFPCGAGTACVGGVTGVTGVTTVAGTVATTVQIPGFVTVALNVVPLLFVADPVLVEPVVVSPVPLALPVTVICRFSLVTFTVVLFTTVHANSVVDTHRLFEPGPVNPTAHVPAAKALLLIANGVRVMTPTAKICDSFFIIPSL